MKKLYTYIALALFPLLTWGQIDRTTAPVAGPEPTINLTQPQTFELKNGLKVLVMENSKLPRVSISLSLDNPPITEGEKAGVYSLVSALMGKGTVNIPKDDFEEEVDFMGASISMGAQGGFASSLSKYTERVMEMMADAAINPNFTEEELEAEREKTLTALKSQENSVAAVSGRVNNALGYGKSHPSGEFETEESVKSVTLADVQKFYRDYFVPANAYLVIVGDIEFKDARKLVRKYFTPWTKASPLTETWSTPKPAQYNQINFVDMPDAVQSQITVQNVVDLKLNSPDLLAARLANSILGGGSEGRLFRNLREDKGYTYGSYSSIGTSKYTPVLFRATAEVRNAVTDSAVVEILKEISSIVNTPVTQEDLDLAKAKLKGSFIRSLEQPQTQANYARNILTENLPEDYYATYLTRLAAVTVEEVQEAAKKYFSMDNFRVVVVGKGADVADKLEMVEFNGKKVPVLYFDKYANRIEKPDFSIPVPEGVTVETVLNGYVDAIGGAEKLAGVNTYMMLAKAEVQGMTLDMEMKKGNKAQFMQEIKLMGTPYQKLVYNDGSGYMLVQGNKMDANEDQLASMKTEADIFPEVAWLAEGNATLEKIAKVDGKNAYLIKNGGKEYYYDVETGFKVQTIEEQEAQGQTIKVTVKFSDYRDVDGIKFPYLLQQIAGPQALDFNVTEVKVNEGVSDSDFE